MHQTPVPGDQQFGYQPALDGLRGVAVALVLFFHGGFSWMAGGYVGVSVFFTLSGYLITSLLILEHGRSGRVSWSAFVARRAKRLLPASLLCLVAIALLAAGGEFAGVPHLRRDITTAALQVANWNALHGSGSYADLLSRSAGLSSPVEHYWSLSVEEQFYWLWPFAFLLLMKVSKGRLRLFVNLAGVALLGIVGARLIAVHWGPDAAYWATPARLGEILVGAALAAGCLLWQRRSRWLGLLGAAGFAVVLWTAIEWPTRGGPAYAGWFGVFSLASAALILGLQAPGLLRAAFSLMPLVWLGRISYGVYVYHWPIFLLVTRRSVHVHGWPLFLLRFGITLVVAVVSYWLIERPVRRSTFASHVALSMALPATAVVVVFTLLVVPSAPGRRTVTAETPAATTTQTGSTTRATTVSVLPPTEPAGRPTTTVGRPTTELPTTTEVLPSGPVNLVLIGDSTADALHAGVQAWAAAAPDRTVVSVAQPGCGLIRNTVLLGDDGEVFAKQCSKALDRELPAALAAQRPQEALIMITLPDAAMRQWSGDEGMLPPDDDRYAARMLDDYRAIADLLVAAGVQHIAWVVPPAPGDWWIGWMSDIAYDQDSWNQLSITLAALAVEYPDVVEVVHLDEWFAESGATTDESMREDGLHLTDAGALRVMDEFLGPVLLRLTVV